MCPKNIPNETYFLSFFVHLLSIICLFLSLPRYLATRFTTLTFFFSGGFTKFERKYPAFCDLGEDVDRPILSLSGLTIQDSENNREPLKTEPSTPQVTDHQESRVKVPVQILPYLYLGSEKDSSDLDILTKYGISYVLNVTHDKPNSFEHLPGFKYKKLPVEDNWRANLSDLFPEAFDFIGMYQKKYYYFSIILLFHEYFLRLAVDNFDW